MGKSRSEIVAAAAMGLGMMFGCTGVPLKTEVSTSSIHAAREAGADDVPVASFYLQLAKDELVNARALWADGKEVQAESMLMRAEADATLAAALSREDAEKVEAADAVERVIQLRAEIR